MRQNNNNPPAHAGTAASEPAIVIVDPRLQVVQKNAAARTLFGEGDSAFDLFDALTANEEAFDLSDAVQKVITTGGAATFGKVNCPHALLTIDCQPLCLSESDAPTGCIVIARPTAAVAQHDPDLAKSLQLATVGALTARVAHELNNLLDGILRYINLAIAAPTHTEESRTRRYLDESKTGLMRMIHITRDLLEFSRTKPTTHQQAGIPEIVEDVLKLTKSAAATAGVEIVQRVDDCPLVQPVSAQLFQVFCNLTKNAIEAMPEGGTLTITARRESGDLVITFEDTGPGLPASAEQVFEPFFTTRAPGAGTGLGLAICRDLIERCCSGTITAINRPQGGARFEVRMPADPQHAGGGQLVRQ
ncbi:MAG: HAMP domain-containing histidine kinase [Planctomycetes bacterium]|nr:HAMP domain-containing histidine kinase [Planctomycetota bacterium]